jgi:hypothetical protein
MRGEYDVITTRYESHEVGDRYIAAIVFIPDQMYGLNPHGQIVKSESKPMGSRATAVYDLLLDLEETLSSFIEWDRRRERWHFQG